MMPSVEPNFFANRPTLPALPIAAVATALHCYPSIQTNMISQLSNVGGTVRGDACTNVSKYHSNHPPITSWHLFKKYMKIDNRHLTDSKKVVYTLAININVNYVRNKCRWGCVNKIKDVSNGLHDLGQMRGNTKLQSLVPQYHHYSNECWRSRIPNIFVER